MTYTLVFPNSAQLHSSSVCTVLSCSINHVVASAEVLHGHHKIPWTAFPTADHDRLIATYLCFLHVRDPMGIPWKPQVHLAVHLVLSAGRFGNPSSFTSQFAPSGHDFDVHIHFLQQCS